MSAPHIHDCTGPDMRCPCGFILRVAPISVSIEIYDRTFLLVNEGFNCDTVSGAIDALEQAIRKLRFVTGGWPR